MSQQNQPDALVTLKEKFDRMLQRLGPRHERGTMRHQFEMDFCYITRELDDCPGYLYPKLLEQGNELYNKLAGVVKLTQQKQEHGQVS
jgi:hypothetical protein